MKEAVSKEAVFFFVGKSNKCYICMIKIEESNNSECRKAYE